MGRSLDLARFGEKILISPDLIQSAVFSRVITVADPFVVNHDNRLIVLVEVEGFSLRNSYQKLIGVIEVFLKNQTFEYLGELSLNTDTEYSFPYVFEDEKHFYLLPDATDMGIGRHKNIDVFKTSKDLFPFGWAFHQRLHFSEVESPSDKVLIKFGKDWYLFVSDSKNGGVLHLFFSNDFINWSPHPLSPVLTRGGSLRRLLNRVLPYRFCKILPWRLAGKPIATDMGVALPVQHQFHNKVYGESLSIMDISTLTPLELEFSISKEPVFVPSSNDRWRSKGMHHFSFAEEVGDLIFALDGFDGRAWSVLIGKTDNLESLGLET